MPDAAPAWTHTSNKYNIIASIPDPAQPTVWNICSINSRHSSTTSYWRHPLGALPRGPKVEGIFWSTDLLHWWSDTAWLWRSMCQQLIQGRGYSHLQSDGLQLQWFWIQVYVVSNMMCVVQLLNSLFHIHRTINSSAWFNYIECDDINTPHILRCHTSVTSSRVCKENHRLLVKCSKYSVLIKQLSDFVHISIQSLLLSDCMSASTTLALEKTTVEQYNSSLSI